MATKLEALYKKKSKRIVLDVSQVELMDSRGLGSMMYYFTLMKREGRKLVVLNTNTTQSGYMYQLFQQTHLDQVLPIISDPAELK
jgi:anti-anti-sigma factor